jgi:O-antigen/teichoic acid export membrane protein
MKRILFKNSLSGIVQLAITTLLTFLVIPVFIHKLGSEKYGVFSVISVIGNLNIFSNLGLNTSLVKYIAEQGKTRQSDHDILVTLILLHIIIVPLTILAFIFKYYILSNILNIPESYFSDASIMFQLLLISNYILLISQCFVSVLNALQRMYLSNILRLIYSLLYWILILFVLLTTTNFKYIGITILSSAIIYIILLLVAFYRLWGIPRISGISRNFRFSVKKQFSYSLKIYSAGVLSFMFNPLTKILISKYIGLNEVGYYDIAIRIKNNALKLLTRPLEALYPMQAHVKEKAKNRLLVHDIEQKSFYFIAPITVAIFFITAPFINIWLSSNNELIINGVIYLSISFLVSLITTPNYQYLIAKGMAQKAARLQLVNVISNLILFFTLYQYFGYYAAIISNCSSIILSFALSLYYQHKYLNSLIFDTPSQLFRFIIAVFLLFMITYIFNNVITEIIDNLIIKMISTGFFILVFSILLYRYLKIITVDDVKRYFYFNKKIQRTVETVLIKKGSKSDEY